MCKNCGRQFVENPTKKVISKETWNLVDKLLYLSTTKFVKLIFFCRIVASSNKKMELTTKAEPISHKFKYFSDFCVSSFLMLGLQGV